MRLSASQARFQWVMRWSLSSTKVGTGEPSMMVCSRWRASRQASWARRSAVTSRRVSMAPTMRPSASVSGVAVKASHLPPSGKWGKKSSASQAPSRSCEGQQRPLYRSVTAPRRPSTIRSAITGRSAG